eukprot:UN09967
MTEIYYFGKGYTIKIDENDSKFSIFDRVYPIKILKMTESMGCKWTPH